MQRHIRINLTWFIPKLSFFSWSCVSVSKTLHGFDNRIWRKKLKLQKVLEFVIVDDKTDSNSKFPARSQFINDPSGLININHTECTNPETSVNLNMCFCTVVSAVLCVCSRRWCSEICQRLLFFFSWTYLFFLVFFPWFYLRRHFSAKTIVH